MFMCMSVLRSAKEISSTVHLDLRALCALDTEWRGFLGTVSLLDTSLHHSPSLTEHRCVSLMLCESGVGWVSVSSVCLPGGALVLCARGNIRNVI